MKKKASSQTLEKQPSQTKVLERPARSVGPDNTTTVREGINGNGTEYAPGYSIDSSTTSSSANTLRTTASSNRTIVATESGNYCN